MLLFVWPTHWTRSPGTTTLTRPAACIPSWTTPNVCPATVRGVCPTEGTGRRGAFSEQLLPCRRTSSDVEKNRNGHAQEGFVTWLIDFLSDVTWYGRHLRRRCQLEGFVFLTGKTITGVFLIVLLRRVYCWTWIMFAQMVSSRAVVKYTFRGHQWFYSCKSGVSRLANVLKKVISLKHVMWRRANSQHRKWTLESFYRFQ